MTPATKLPKKGQFMLTEMYSLISNRQKVETIFDRLTFLDIFIIWISIILVFGFAYYGLQNGASHLSYSETREPVSLVSDAMYFSFITATSTGFGDIVPSGIFKFIAILEVICGLLLLAFVTSKLVSIKQDMILDEIYEISFNERLNRLRLSLLGFRQNMSRITSSVEEGSSRTREIQDLYIYLTSLESILNEIYAILERAGSSRFTKGIDALHADLISQSIIQSFEKIDELLRLLAERKVEWRREITLKLLKSCIALFNQVFDKLATSTEMDKKSISELLDRRKQMLASLRSHMS